MKKKALAILLVLCMVLSMLPATVFAAHDGEQLQKLAVPETIGKLEPAVIEPNAKSYKVSLTGGSHGETELLVSSPAEKGSEVYFLANPDDGYLAEIHFSGLDAEDFVYIGMDIWGFIMPGNKVTLEVEYVAAEGYANSITVRASDGGEYALERESAKRYESVLLGVLPNDGVEFDPETDVTNDKGDLYYLMEDEYGIHYYELVMGSYDVNIEIRFGDYKILRYIDLGHYSEAAGTVTLSKTALYPGEEFIVTAVPNYGYTVREVVAAIGTNANQVPFTAIGNNQYKAVMPDADIRLSVRFNAIYRNMSINVVGGVGGKAKLNSSQAQPGTTVTITCTPDENYRVYSITGVDSIVDNGNNTYTFTMPDRDVVINVTFRKIYNPVTVTVDTGIGGTASADLTEAKAGDVVTLTCVPEEGYRLAQITGADVTDNGDNTYTFTMPDGPADIHVLFLRHENPFVDVNETHFFYDPVLWAVENGITNGIDATHFGPFQTTNRAAVVTMLWRWAGSPEPTAAENPFTDVPAEGWYTKPVLWAVENGITNGISATEFGPDGLCNRAQVVTFLYRYLKAAAPEGLENPFEDVPAGEWYEAPVLWALANGVTTGADATHFNPNGECLRAQFVTFLYRASLIPPTEYALSYAADPAEGGEIALSHETAVAGETITVTVTPAEGYVIASVTCESGAEVTQLSETEYTFVMPAQAETVLVTFEEIPVEPTDPEEPDPTDPTEPEEPVKTYTLDVRTNVNAEITYVDGKTAAAPGESIFFYVIPEDGYVLTGVGLFDPNNEIDLSKIKLYAHEDNLYEFVMIDQDVILNFSFDLAS